MLVGSRQNVVWGQRRSDELFENVGSVLVTLRQRLSVDAARHRRIGVSETAGNRAHINTSSDELSGGEVSQIVEPEPHTERRSETDEPLRQQVRIERLVGTGFVTQDVRIGAEWNADSICERLDLCTAETQSLDSRIPECDSSLGVCLVGPVCSSYGQR